VYTVKNDLGGEEFGVLWALARLRPGSHAAEVMRRFDERPSKIYGMLLETISEDLEQGSLDRAPTREDVAVLLASSNPRIRAIGVRLAALAE
jgi:hypothetical protein